MRSSDFYFVPNSVSDKLKCAKCEAALKSATSQGEDGLRLKRSAATDADQRVQTKGHAKKRKADADTPTETK